MKFSTVAALLAVSQAQNIQNTAADLIPQELQDEPVEDKQTSSWYDPLGLLATQTTSSAEKKEDLVYALEGLRGLYEGYYSSFYKSARIPSLKTCLNDETIDDIVGFEDVIENPLSLIMDFDITQGMHLFGSTTQIADDLVKCNFQEPLVDIYNECFDGEGKCSVTAISENLSKNMFVLMGKATSMAETFKDFPAADMDDFKEQMTEFGADIGTILRVIFNFQTIDGQPTYHRSKYMPEEYNPEGRVATH